MLATGTYHILYHGQLIGRENWDLIRGPTAGYELSSYISLSWPVKSYQQVRWIVDQTWLTQTLDLSFDDGQQWQAAQSGIMGDQWLTRRLSSEGQASETRLPIAAATQIDFSSPVFNFVLFRRIGIQVGTSTDVDMITFSLPGLQVHHTQQRFICLGSEAIEVVAGRFSTYHFTVTSANGPDEVTNLWVTAQGFVVRLTASGGEDVTELVRFEVA